MNSRLVIVIATAAVLLPALAAPPADASRKLSVATLEVPPTGQAGEKLAIAGTVSNSGDEKARTTVRAYLRDTVGQLRLGGRRVGIAAGSEAEFSLAPPLPDGAPDGDYEIAVCVQRRNRRGPTRCATSPLTIE